MRHWLFGTADFLKVGCCYVAEFPPPLRLSEGSEDSVHEEPPKYPQAAPVLAAGVSLRLSVQL
ncbi:MAG: hypothetical protein LAT83_16790, partial [Kiritimatiellae bacterium]|nr:hypothetical protein [Kiritimatiellia bacterium]